LVFLYNRPLPNPAVAGPPVSIAAILSDN